MRTRAASGERVFKTAWFGKAAKKAHISDIELCAAIAQVMLGQADDLGGGVFKKRLGRNLHRSIILARGGRFWIYSFLFAKKDRANISQEELVEFRRAASLYAQKTDADIASELNCQELVEICHDQEAKL